MTEQHEHDWVQVRIDSERFRCTGCDMAHSNFRMHVGEEPLGPEVWARWAAIDAEAAA